MLFKRNFLIYVIGLVSIVTYNVVIASPVNSRYSVDALKVDTQRGNPWAVKKRTIQPPVKSNRFQYSAPINRTTNEPRFITEHELKALNHQQESTNGLGYSSSWKPLPPINSIRQGSGYRNPYYGQQYDDWYGNQYDDLMNGNNQWNDASHMYSTDVIDPMDSGQYGMPFSDSVQGIDSFIYE